MTTHQAREAVPPDHPERRKRMAVISWDLCHNAVGRAYLLAEIASRDFDVEVIGAKFSRFGSSIWGPLQQSEIPIRGYPADGTADFIDGAINVALNTFCDVVYISKPRLPSIIQGLLIARANSCPVLLDVDDHELSFYAGSAPITIGEARRYLLSKNSDDDDAQVPMGRLWTSVAETLIESFPFRTVSNVALRDRFSGHILRHARDETRLQQSLPLRDAIRAEFGCGSDDVVILFLGTPRPHKGVSRIARALDKLKSKRLKLIVIGGVDTATKAEFATYSHARIDIFPEQPWDRLSTLVAMANVVCLPQDPNSSITQFQVPAKLSDALANGIPTIISNVAPMADIPDDVVQRISDDEDLLQALKACEAGRFSTTEMSDRRKAYFRAELSFDKARQTLSELCSDGLAEGYQWHPEWTGLFALLNRYWPRASLQAFDRRCALRHTGARGPSSAPALPDYVPITPDCQFDVVMFWKQNDTGIYGRRHDMMVRYLSRHPRVRKILVIDAPISLAALNGLASVGDKSRFSQNNLVYLNTLQRFLRMSDRGNVAERVFIYADGVRSTLAGIELQRSDDYPRFVTAQIRDAFDGTLPVVAYVCPVVFDFPSIARAFPFSLVIADLIDDQRTMTNNEDLLGRIDSAYRQTLALADVVTTNCLPVAQAFADCCKTIDVLPNACETDEAAVPRPCPDDLADLPRPILGYVGNLGDRLDTDLIRAIATERPQWSIVLIGSTHRAPEALMLQDLHNIHLLGVRPHESAKSYIANFDVAIMPHVTNSVSENMNPLKLFVYASLGVPVVTSDSPNIGEVRDYVSVASGAVDFVEAVENALRRPRANIPQSALHAVSWTARIERLMGLIDSQSASLPNHGFFALQRGDRAVKADIIRQSGLLDADWYVARYRDVQILGMGALDHYVQIGEALLRDPRPDFSTSAYLARHPQTAGGLGPFVDFILRQANTTVSPLPVRRSDSLEHYASMRIHKPPQRLRLSFDHVTAEHFKLQAEAALSQQQAAIYGTLASIVMPTFNRRKTIGTAIASILAQTHSNWELVIVDDGSDDGTPEYIDSHFHDPRIKIIRTAQRGVSAARNAALRQAKGRFVFFLDSDNAWLPDHMRVMLTYLITCNARCGYAAIQLMSGGKVEGYLGEPFDWDHCLKANYVDLNVFACSREMANEIGEFDESLRRMVDWDFILRAGRLARPLYAPIIGCIYNNDQNDDTRITNREPLAYRAIVHAKHSSSFLTHRHPRYRIAIKIDSRGQPSGRRGNDLVAETLKAAFEHLGHSVRIDLANEWYATPPNHDHVVVVMGGSERYRQRAGEIGIHWCGDTAGHVVLDELAGFDIAYVASRGLPTLLGAALGTYVSCLPWSADERPLARDVASPLDHHAQAILQDIQCFLCGTQHEDVASLDARQRDGRFCIGLLLQRCGTNYSEAAYRRILSPLTADDVIGRLQPILLTGPDDERLPDCDACVVQSGYLMDEKKAERLADVILQHDVPLFVDAAEIDLIHCQEFDAKGVLTGLMNMAAEIWSPVAPPDAPGLFGGAPVATVAETLDSRLWQNRRNTQAGPDGTPLEFLCVVTFAGENITDCLRAFDALHLQRPDSFRLTLIGLRGDVAERPWLRLVDPPGPHLAYPLRAHWLRQLGRFDVGIVPPSAPHLSTSTADCRFLEYSALGLASIVPARMGWSRAIDDRLAVVVAKGDWLTALEGPFDGGARKRMAKQSHDHVWRECNALNPANTIAGRLLDYLMRDTEYDGRRKSSEYDMEFIHHAAQ